MGKEDKYRKRMNTLVSKSHELASLCRTNVYLVIHHPGRDPIVYNSTLDGTWPPSDEDLVTTAFPLSKLKSH